MTVADTTFETLHPLELPGAPARGRVGTIHTPHGPIRTPEFIPVGTAASVKTLTSEQVADLGAQAVLANAYHLHLRPGDALVDEAGGLGAFMQWPGPTYTDSGGFQVMSLGAGFKKTISMDAAASPDDNAVAPGKERLATIDDDGVTFRSHLNGDRLRFTPEVSMSIQHRLGADIIFAFDELTTLMNTRQYQEQSVERTRRWAERCLLAHDRLTRERPHRPLQSLWGVIQGAQHEDLRRSATRGLVELGRQATAEGRRGWGGWGIGGALEKHRLGTIVGWCVDELPADQPRHLLGISEPDDIFAAVENGADTFDCVAPTRLARHGHVMTRHGRLRIRNAEYKHDHRVLDEHSAAPTSRTYTRAYLHHLIRAGEPLGATLATSHNLAFMLTLMAELRCAIAEGRYPEFKAETLGRYYGS